MPSTDITKCANSAQCPLKETCWRNLCPSEMLQSYADFYKEDNICFNYIRYSKNEQDSDKNDN